MFGMSAPVFSDAAAGEEGVATALPELAAFVRLRGEQAGLDAVGITTAEPFLSTRVDLRTRKEAGLHGGMAFTYRNPDRSTDPSASLRDARALVVGAWRYAAPAPAPARVRVPADSRAARRPHARVARYATDDHYALLRAALETVAAALRNEGWKAVVVADSNALVDREAAYRAGIGWYGKNTNLLLPGHGSWFVLGTVITDAPLVAAAPPVVADGCGTCSRCLSGCPTKAIVAPGVVDARRCLAWLVQQRGDIPLEFRAALGDRIYGCDDCQEVCPPSRLSPRGEAAEAGSSAGGGSSDDDGTSDDNKTSHDDGPDVLALLSATDDELLTDYGRWYIPDRDPDYLRRNALVVLGNVGNPWDDDVMTTVDRWRREGSPLVQRHAEWAAETLRRRRNDETFPAP